MNTPWFNFFMSELRASNWKGVQHALHAGVECGYLDDPETDDLVFSLLTKPDLTPLVELYPYERQMRDLLSVWLYMRTPLFDYSPVNRPSSVGEAYRIHLDRDEDEWQLTERLEAYVLHSVFMSQAPSPSLAISTALMSRGEAIETWFDLLQKVHDGDGVRHGGIYGSYAKAFETLRVRVFQHIFLEGLSEKIRAHRKRPFQPDLYRSWDFYSVNDLVDEEEVDGPPLIHVMLRCNDAHEAYQVLKDAYDIPGACEKYRL